MHPVKIEVSVTTFVRRPFLKSVESQVTHRSNQILTGNSVCYNRINRHKRLVKKEVIFDCI